jgi:hypothetical protein
VLRRQSDLIAAVVAALQGLLTEGPINPPRDWLIKHIKANTKTKIGFIPLVSLFAQLFPFECEPSYNEEQLSRKSESSISNTCRVDRKGYDSSFYDGTVILSEEYWIWLPLRNCSLDLTHPFRSKPNVHRCCLSKPNRNKKKNVPLHSIACLG